LLQANAQDQLVRNFSKRNQNNRIDDGRHFDVNAVFKSNASLKPLTNLSENFP